MPTRHTRRGLLIPLAPHSYHRDAGGAGDRTEVTSLSHVEARREAAEGPRRQAQAPRGVGGRITVAATRPTGSSPALRVDQR